MFKLTDEKIFRVFYPPVFCIGVQHNFFIYQLRLILTALLHVV